MSQMLPACTARSRVAALVGAVQSRSDRTAGLARESELPSRDNVGRVPTHASAPKPENLTPNDASYIQRTIHIRTLALVTARSAARCWRVSVNRKPLLMASVTLDPRDAPVNSTGSARRRVGRKTPPSSRREGTPRNTPAFPPAPSRCRVGSARLVDFFGRSRANL